MRDTRLKTAAARRVNNGRRQHGKSAPLPAQPAPPPAQAEPRAARPADPLAGHVGEAGRTLFDTPRYQAKPAQRRYAEKQHALKYGPGAGDQRGKQGTQPSASRHGRWRRGPMLSSHGYVKVRVGTSHPLADPHGYAYAHLLVWVAAGNPRPASSVCLQWWNEDRTDNRIENLYLITRAERERRRNARAIRDPRGRVLSNAVARAVKRGAAVRYNYGDRRVEG